MYASYLLSFLRVRRGGHHELSAAEARSISDRFGDSAGPAGTASRTVSKTFHTSTALSIYLAILLSICFSVCFSPQMVGTIKNYY